MLKLPSIPAAILAGGVVFPIFAWGWRFLDETFHSQLLVFAWVVMGFLIPVLLSTADMKYVVRKWRKEGFLRPAASLEDFKVFYIPAWIRMFVWFVSAVASFLILEAAGVNLP